MVHPGLWGHLLPGADFFEPPWTPEPCLKESILQSFRPTRSCLGGAMFLHQI
jgi:hypothetical protein